MKKTLFILVLAFVMCSVNGSAQTKKPVSQTTEKGTTKSIAKDSRDYKMENDGFEWYKICKNGKYGAEDKNSHILVPAEYDDIKYHVYDTSRDMIYNGPGFTARKDKYYSYYLRNGKCVIPFTRKYIEIIKHTAVDEFYKDYESVIYRLYKSNHKFDHRYGTYYVCRSENRKCSLCDINGKEIFSMDGCVYLSPDDCDGRYFFTFQTGKGDGEGIVDTNGNIIAQPDGHGKSLEYHEGNVSIVSNGKFVASLSSVSSTSNILGNNPREDRTNDTTSSSNTGTGTSTIVVEHHRDPVPVQQWQACWACGGMGTMGCDGCGGSGTKYYGNSLRICSRCNGQGLIPCNVCFGNKGQYTTVYR